jgi:hypothetical protein
LNIYGTFSNNGSGSINYGYTYISHVYNFSPYGTVNIYGTYNNPVGTTFNFTQFAFNNYGVMNINGTVYLNGLLGGVSTGSIILSGTLYIGTSGYGNGLCCRTIIGWPSSPSGFTFSPNSLITGLGSVISSSSSSSPHSFLGIVNVPSFTFYSGPALVVSSFTPLSAIYLFNSGNMIVSGTVTLANYSSIFVTCGTISGPGTLEIPSTSGLYFLDGAPCIHYISNVIINMRGVSVINT